jgi:WD40 repeat protein/predicted Ser/Thr protein kinase
MATHQTCLKCGAPLAAGAGQDFCPKCLFLQASAGFQEHAAETPEDESPEISSPFTAKLSFGDYELLEEIGRGGMGVVYRARQRSLDRIVAIKMMAFGPGSSPELVKRFRAEAVSAAALQHPNIVAIHEVGIHEGRHFFVMDFVEGQSLAQIAKNELLTSKRAAAYLKTIAEAVHYAHERGILHRDLKPSNVLIDAQDQPRIVDFGLARRLDGASELTVTGQVLGSPNYLPPEQATARRGRVSRRTDVYALGATLYHLLTGRPPFQAESFSQTLDLVLHSEPAAPRLLNPSVPRDLETICLKCLEKEPARRYPTAQALADELARFQASEPIHARPLGPTRKVWRWCRRKPQAASLGAAAILVFLLGFVGVVWQWRRAEAEGWLARRNAYAADMNLLQQALEDSDLGRARMLLDRYRPRSRSLTASPYVESKEDLRSWEWRYLWARCQGEERFTLCQYSNSVSALAFSSDAKWLALRRGSQSFAIQDQTVALWDAVAKRPLAELPAAGIRWCKALAFSPKGNLLAWGGKNGRGESVVSLWDVNAQKETPALPHSNRVASLAFSPDAKVLASLAYDGTVRLWDLETQRVVTEFATASVYSRSTPVEDHYGCVVFSPDGRWLAVGEAKPQIRLRDLTTGDEKIISLPAPANGITTLAFSPDSRLLAGGGGEGESSIHLWDLTAGTEVQLTGHGGWIAALAFSPDGQTLASASSDQTVRLWDVARQVETRRFQGNVAEVLAVAWSADGKDLVTGAMDGSVRYWDPDPASRPTAPYAVLPEPVYFWGPTFFPDSKTFLTASRPDGAVVRWDVASAQALETLSFLGTNHTSLNLSQDGRWLALGDGTGHIQVWDFPGRRIVTNLVAPDANVFAVWFSPHGNLLACGAFASDGRTAGKVWMVAGWNEVRLPAVNDPKLFDGNFSPDERILELGYNDGTADWWDLATGRRRAFFECGYADAVHAAFSPDGRHFATGGINGLMTLWDVATQRAKPIGRGYRNGLHDLLFSPDSRRLLASGTNPKDVMKLWDVETGQDVATLPGVPAWYAHIGFSPDGNTLFAASLEGTALLWHAPSFEEIEAKEKGQRVQ